MATPADFVNDPRFSRTFELPADPARSRTRPFKVTYADYGYHSEANPEEDHVLLIFGPLMGSRLHHIAKDDLAKKYKVRIINPDRPGFGGTDPVDVKERMNVWRETLPALLASLDIRHVSIAAHSGGTVYALDFVLHHPHLLHPSRPYLAIGGPWILPSHTGSAALTILQHLPSGVIGSTDTLARLANNYIGPLLGSSAGLSTALMEKLVTGSPSQGVDDAAPEGAKFEEKVWPAILERIYEEGVKGLSGDAMLLLQKVDGTSGWSDWGDYDRLIPRLAETLRASGRRLRVDVFYAEKDKMIGNSGSKGAAWFDRCWNEGAGELIEYESMTVAGADHDGVWSLRWGAMRGVLEKFGNPTRGSTSARGV